MYELDNSDWFSGYAARAILRVLRTRWGPWAGKGNWLTWEAFALLGANQVNPAVETECQEAACWLSDVGHLLCLSFLFITAECEMVQSGLVLERQVDGVDFTPSWLKREK